MSGIDHLLNYRGGNDFLGDWILHELLVPFLLTYTTLGIGKNNMRHHIPWGELHHLRLCRASEWSGIFLYLHVNVGWQLSDFSNFLGHQGTIKACLQFPQFVEGKLIHLLLDRLSLIGSKTRILDLSPGLFWPSMKPSYEISLVSTTTLRSRTVMVGRRFIIRYFGHLE